MTPLGRFDSSIQMFVEMPREIDQDKLRFLRWLWERGKFFDDGHPLGMTIDQGASQAWGRSEAA